MNASLDHAPCGYLVFDDDGRIHDINATLLARLDLARDEAVDHPVDVLLPPAGKVFHQTHFFPLLRMNGHVDEIFLTLRTRSGVDLPFLTSAVRRPGDEGTRNECALLPMNQRRRYEDEILKAQRAAERANRAKAKFLSMMSHDLRTPLQTITATTTVLAHEVHGPLSPGQREDVNRIERASGELLRLLTDILEFSRLDSGRVRTRIKDVQLSAALDRAEALIRPQIDNAGLGYERRCNASLVARADSDRLQQILLNLLTNAIKFTPRGGRVSVDAGRDNGHVLMQVTDNGPGIPADRLDEIFEPFVQIDRDDAQRKGVGLGLAISRELVRAMDGEILASSEPGRGATFTVQLPAALHPREAPGASLLG